MSDVARAVATLVAWRHATLAAHALRGGPEHLQRAARDLRSPLDRECAARLTEIDLAAVIEAELAEWPVPLGALTRRELDGLVRAVVTQTSDRAGIAGRDDRLRRQLVALAVEFVVDRARDGDEEGAG